MAIRALSAASVSHNGRASITDSSLARGVVPQIYLALIWMNVAWAF
jgi:hypothetical protein